MTIVWVKVHEPHTYFINAMWKLIKCHNLRFIYRRNRFKTKNINFRNDNTRTSEIFAKLKKNTCDPKRDVSRSEIIRRILEFCQG